MGTWLYWLAAGGASFVAMLVGRFGSDNVARRAQRPLAVLSWVLIVLGVMSGIGVLPSS